MARRINLVPPSERPRTTTNVGMLVLVVCIILVFFGLGLGYFLLRGDLKDAEQQLADLRQQREMVETQAAGLRQYEQVAAERERREALVQQVYAGRTPVADVLDALSRVVPDTVWFQDLTLTTADPSVASSSQPQTGSSAEQGSLSIQGQTYTFEDVAQLLVRLELIPALSGINLTNAATKGETDRIKNFSVDAVVLNTQDPGIPLPLSQVEVGGL